MIDIIATFIIFFSIIDPIGTIPIYISVTRDHDIAAKRKIALLAVLFSAGILIFFVVFGEIILRAMNIPLAAFQIAGGIVLFLFALTMIFGESKPESELRMVDSEHDTAIFPLAVPSIAGPGAMLTAVLLTEDARFNYFEQLQTVGVMLLVLLVVYILMLGSGFIYKYLGDGGASVISRVMGLILSAAATTNTLNGINSYFNL